MTKHTAAHTAAGLFLAALAALGTAVAVVFCPTVPGQAAAGAITAWAVAHQLRKSRLARKGPEALALGVTVAVLAIVFVPEALPVAAFAALALRPVLHFTDPRRARVVRTTRGVKDPAKRAAGGRTGRPGEKPRQARIRPASALSTPRPARRPAPARVTLAPPEPVITGTWPHVPGYDYAAELPWAGEGTVMTGDAPVTGKKLRRDERRPTKVHRSLCGGCAARECGPGLCKSRGCECAAPAHDVPPF